MTIERAAEIVNHARCTNGPCIDLYNHFVNYFNLKDNRLNMFDIMCGFVSVIAVD